LLQPLGAGCVGAEAMARSLRPAGGIVEMFKY